MKVGSANTGGLVITGSPNLVKSVLMPKGLTP